MVQEVWDEGFGATSLVRNSPQEGLSRPHVRSSPNQYYMLHGEFVQAPHTGCSCFLHLILAFYCELSLCWAMVCSVDQSWFSSHVLCNEGDSLDPTICDFCLWLQGMLKQPHGHDSEVFNSSNTAGTSCTSFTTLNTCHANEKVLILQNFLASEIMTHILTVLPHSALL